MENNEIKGTLVYIPIGELFPHPDNPRKELGDLQELADSIKAKGIMQNLTVVRGHKMTDEEWQICNEKYAENPTEELRKLLNTQKVQDGYTVIIGHRRRAAAEIAGLTELPCVITDMDEKDQMSTMLLENMQRNDLTLCEQAQGFQMMIDFGDSVEDISEKSGFSKTTVRKRLKLATLDRDKFREAEPRGGTIEDFIAIAEIKDEKTRTKLMDDIGTNRFDWELKDAQKKQLLNEKMPTIKREMQAIRAKKDDSIYSWDAKYKKVAEVEVKDFEAGCIKEKLKTGKKYYWNTYNDACVCVYTDAPKPKKEKKPPKSEREILADERRKRLAELSEQAYERRKDFVSNFIVTKYTEKAVQEWLWEIAYKILAYSRPSTSCELLCEKTGEKNERYKYRFERENIDKYVAEAPKNAPVVILDALSGDNKSLNYYHENFGEKLPTHCQSDNLNFIYGCLCSLGYEMSDVELALQNGTHELFDKSESEGDNE